MFMNMTSFWFREIQSDTLPARRQWFLNTTRQSAFSRVIADSHTHTSSHTVSVVVSQREKEGPARLTLSTKPYFL